MTIPVSTVPTARVALQAQIVAAVADTTVLVRNGPPGPSVPDDVIAILGVERTASASAFVGDLGQHSTMENYTIAVTVSVYRGGDSAVTVDARAWALASAVETAVRTDPTLGGALNIVARPGTSSTEGPVWESEHKGVVEEIHLTVTCSAQI